MKLLLKRPIIFFDLETTGVDVTKDRIVQIGCVKINTDGTTEEKEMLINPAMPIPKEASDVHGITNEMVKDSPLFINIYKALFKFFEGCDLGGYNSDNYDVPLLMEEFSRCGLTFPAWECNLVDVLKFERLLNDNKLGSVYKRYTGLELENAHSAIADIKATIEIFMCQTKDMEVVDPQEIDSLCQGDRKRADIAGKMYINEDSEVCWSFGKNMGKTILSDIPYAEWVLKNNFPSETKEKIRKIINR